MEIVLIDDDPTWTEFVDMVLRGAGARVRSFTDSDSGLAAARDVPPDLLIFDLELPGRDGFALLREVRSDRVLRLTPLLILSGHHDERSRTAAFHSGADCYLPKNVPLDELLAAVAALARHGRDLRDLESSESVLFAMARMVDLHCLETLGHMERCAVMARSFGEFLGLPEPQLRTLERAGYLHDVGKIGIDWDVINKRGPLSPDERAQMEQHPVLGVRICEPLQSLRDVLPIIRHHHERWDGGGYPDGLEGEEVPPLVRVFQIVDIYEALRSRRSYKDEVSREQALQTLREEAARGWRDPALVERFTQGVEAGLLGRI